MNSVCLGSFTSSAQNSLSCSPETTTMPRIAKSPRRHIKQRLLRGSLRSILRQHLEAKLFVPPKYWTDLHSRLLGARFCKLPPCDTPMPDMIPGLPPSKGQLRPSKDINILLRALNDILDPKGGPVVSNAVKTVMSKLWPAAFGDSHHHPALHIFFDKCVYREQVCAQVMWNHPRASSDRLSQRIVTSTNSLPTHCADGSGSRSTTHNPAGLPMMCYVGRHHLAAMRKTTNGLHYERLKPAVPDHDSHLVAIFLAMAQRHFYGTTTIPSNRNSSRPFSKSKSCPTCFHTLVLKILSHDSDTAEFIVYTGHVTSVFLDMFYDPSFAPKSHPDRASAPSITIDYTKVPIWPIMGLRERLGKALGDEIVGLFDSSTMATWTNDANDGLATENKRKTEVVPGQVRRGPKYMTYIGREEVKGGQWTINPPGSRPCLSSLCRKLHPYTVRAKELDARGSLIPAWRRPGRMTFCKHWA